MGRLDGKVAIVTGGSRGMGAATCRLFVAEGAKVAIADVLDENGRALAAELGPSSIYVHLDVAKEENWLEAIVYVEAHFGPIDVLVNNAGVLLFKSIVDTSADDLQRVINVNLLGSFFGVRCVGRGMVERGHGSIVNISSIDGLKATNGCVAYGISKWGVRGMTKVAAMEFGPKGVRVNSVHPGGVDTVMANQSGLSRDELNKPLRGKVPLQRIGNPEEVAAASLFLASDESSYMTGSEVVVDGGWTIGTYEPSLPGAPEI